VKLFLVGRIGGITHWLEDAAAAFRAEGHEVRIGAVRRSWLNAGLEAALSPWLAAAMADDARRFAPDLVLVIGGFHAPLTFLDRLAALPGRPPMAGWVGDLFDAQAGAAARLYDVVAYTDSGLLARHTDLAFSSRAMFLPHAANLAAAPAPARRVDRMVFAGNATPGRRALIEQVTAPMAVFGPGWAPAPGSPHEMLGRRVPHKAVAGLYARHLAALNIRNERNVLAGLNQRSFDPCLSGTPVVSDRQADLERCFEPGAEVVVYGDAGELNDAYDRLRRFPDEASRIGQAGRRRVLADHGYGRRLAALRAEL
jgi:spore maturation protein CgeB